MNIIRLQGNAEKRSGIYYEYDADATPLGEGGMGRVFKGFRVVERTGERMSVAIKAIYDNIPERVVERARREANIQLDNDNLIRMYGFVETISHYEGGTKSKVHYHVIMELLVGVTLEDIMNGVTSDQNGMQIPFAAELYSQYTQNRNAAVVRIMKSILSGLMALHDKGYIHRDIDPSNVMVTIDGKIKLIDFGICKQIVSLESLDKALTATGVFMGKVNYAAPELVLGDVKSQNYTTDIYALGVLLYQLCTGHLPFTGTDQDILSANLRKSLPMGDVRRSDFKKIIRKATEKVQSKRYASVAELRVDLERISTNGTNGGNGKLGIIVGVSVVVILIIGAVLLLRNSNDDNIDEPIVKQLTCEEIYQDAIAMVNQGDSVHLRIQGKEKLRMLVEDSLYTPAKMRYYVLLLNSNDSTEVKKGFYELKQIAQTDTLNTVALFECGLTLSKSNPSNPSLSVPMTRQSLLKIEPDLQQANHWLIKVMQIDTSDYKSAYWALRNLIEMKSAESNGIKVSLPLNIDNQIVEFYETFEKRVKNNEDVTAQRYKDAINDDRHTLWVWGLIDK